MEFEIINRSITKSKLMCCKYKMYWMDESIPKILKMFDKNLIVQIKLMDTNNRPKYIRDIRLENIFTNYKNNLTN